MPNSQHSRAFQHVEGTDQVRLDIGARVLQRIAYARLCCEVDDDLGPLPLAQRLQAGMSSSILSSQVKAGDCSRIWWRDRFRLTS